MNPAINSLYAEYLEHTNGDKAAAASLTLATTIAENGGKTPPDTALTVAETARRLNVTRQTVYEMCQSGRLRSFRAGNGRTLRIPAEAVETCENTSGAREPAPQFPDIIKRHF
ncbi:MAG: helix-turn-helix domain-containing protein [Thermoguttaceae bacterium]